MPTWALSELESDWDRGYSADAAGRNPATWQWLVMAPPAVPQWASPFLSTLCKPARSPSPF